MALSVEVWSNYEAAGGTRTAFIDQLSDSGQLKFDLQQRNRLDLLIPQDSASRISFRDVLRVKDHFGTITEWRVDTIDDPEDPGAQGIRVGAQSSYEDIMRNTGLVFNTSGGVRKHNNGAYDTTPTQYLTQFVTNVLSNYGIGWVGLGTVNYSDTYDLAFEGVTPLEVINKVRDVTGGEVEWVRTSATGYTLNLKTLVGDQTKKIRVTPDKNLIRLNRAKELRGMASVLVPKGVRDSTNQERHGIGFAAWKVTNVATATGKVTLSDPNGGAGPVKYADQFNGRYILRANAATAAATGDPASDLYLTKITDTATGGVFTVNSTKQFATGDLVEIRADATGNLLDELSAPSATSSYRRLVRTFDQDDMRGERNQVPNAFFSDWPSRWRVFSGRQVGTQLGTGAGTSVNVQDFDTGGLALTTGMWLCKEAAKSTRLIASGVTLATDGSGTITIKTALGGTYTSGTRYWILDKSGRDPDQVVGLAATGSLTAHMLLTLDRSQKTTVTGGTLKNARNLNYVAGGAGDGPSLVISGLATGTTIYAGSRVRNITATQNDAIQTLVDTAVSASGEANLRVLGAMAIGWATGASVVFDRPQFSGPGATGVIPGIANENNNATSTGAPGFETSPFSVRYTSAFPTLWVSAGVSIIRYNPSNRSYATTGNPPPRLSVFDWDGASKTTLGSVNATDFTLSGFVAHEPRINYKHTLTADQDFVIGLDAAEESSGITQPATVTYVRYLQAALTSDENCPPVYGSHANPLWQLANTKLGTRSVIPTAYEALWSDLSQKTNMSRDQPELGSWVKLQVPERSIDTEVRIVELRLHPTRPEDTRVILDSRPDLLSEQIQPTIPPVFVDVEVTTAATGGTAKTVEVTSDQPPARTEGTVRFDGNISSFVTYTDE